LKMIALNSDVTSVQKGVKSETLTSYFNIWDCFYVNSLKADKKLPKLLLEQGIIYEKKSSWEMKSCNPQSAV
jgi:hypothetical protein